MSERGRAGTIDVLVVEDSPAARDYLVFILESDPCIRVAGTAASGEAALGFMAENRVDAVLMDIHLPGIDGYETTRRIMSTDPVPVVVCTGSTRFNGVSTALDTLKAGALAVVKKPSGFGDPDADVEAAAVVETLKLMSEVRVVRRWDRLHRADTETPSAVGDSWYPVRAYRDVEVVAIGASTGGPPAIAEIMAGLSPEFAAPILMVQHIAAGFTPGFASWLASIVSLPVHVAGGGEIPLPGHVYVAPDDRHLRIGTDGGLETSDDDPVHGLRPSVGVLFESVAMRYGPRAVGVLLTGMGRDGARELKAMADQGALTVAQDEESSVVFGMPAEAIKLGAARFVLPPKQIAEFLVSSVRSHAS